MDPKFSQSTFAQKKCAVKKNLGRHMPGRRFLTASVFENEEQLF